MTDTQDDSSLPRPSRLGVLWTTAGILVLALGIIVAFRNIFRSAKTPPGD